MKKKEKDIIRQSVLFGRLTDEEFLLIQSYFENDPHIFSKGSLIYSPAQYKRSLGIILKGDAIVKRENGTLMSLLTAGKCFGIPVLYSDQPFPTDIEAKTDCTVYFITREEFSSMMNIIPHLTEIFCSYLSDRIVFLNDRLDSMSFANTDDRLYAYLVNLSSKTDGETFLLPVSMSDLASVLSVGRTSLYRSFDSLQEKGMIKKNEKQITVI